MPEYYQECFRMWLKWIKPTSPFISKLSFIATVLGLTAWVIIKYLVKAETSNSLPEAISFGVFLAGLVISVAMLVFVAPAKLWLQDKPLRELAQLQRNNPKDYIFPYIRTVSAFAVINAGESYLSIGVYFPSALNTDLGLNALGGRFIINGISLDLKLKSIKILKHAVSDISDWHIDLTKQALDLVKKADKDRSPVHVSLELIDAINREYHWSVQEWTTLLLTRVN